MKILCYEHHPLEGPCGILGWAAQRGHQVVLCPWHDGHSHAREEADALLIMGGGMNIYQHRDHPWLIEEKALIQGWIASSKPIAGICLGAQLLADALGGRVFQNPCREIGWFPVELHDPAGLGLDPSLRSLQVLHWHGDTFSMPEKAKLLASSPACSHQAFVWEDRVWGLQFHPELDAPQVALWVEEERHRLTPERWVQSPEEVLAKASCANTLAPILETMLDHIFSR